MKNYQPGKALETGANIVFLATIENSGDTELTDLDINLYLNPAASRMKHPLLEKSEKISFLPPHQSRICDLPVNLPDQPNADELNFRLELKDITGNLLAFAEVSFPVPVAVKQTESSEIILDVTIPALVGRDILETDTKVTIKTTVENKSLKFIQGLKVHLEVEGEPKTEKMLAGREASLPPLAQNSRYDVELDFEISSEVDLKGVVIRARVLNADSTILGSAEKKYSVEKNRELTLYNKIQTAHEISACRAYLKQYPTGRFVAQVKEEYESQFIEEMERSCDAALLDEYVNKFPNGRSIEQVWKRKDLLKDIAKHENNLSGYRALHNKWGKEGGKCLEKILRNYEALLFSETNKSCDDRLAVEYLEAFPKAEHYTKVESRHKMLADIAKAKKEDSFDAYLNVVRLFKDKACLQDIIPRTEMVYWQEVFKSHPGAHPLFQIGRIHEYYDHFREAEDSYKKALQLDANYGEPRIRLAQMYFDRGDSRECINQLASAERSSPNDYRIAQLYGKALVKNDRRMEAIGKFSRALELHPASAECHFYRGEAYLVELLRDKARDDFQHVVEICTRDCDASKIIVDQAKRYLEQLGAKIAISWK